MCNSPKMKCAYVLCQNKSSGRSFFRFPTTDPKRLNDWINNCGNGTITHLTPEALRNRYICSDHFKKRYILNENGRRKRLCNMAVPMHFRRDDTTESAPDSPVASTSRAQQSPELTVLKPIKVYPCGVKRQAEDTEEENEETFCSTPKERRRQVDQRTLFESALAVRVKEEPAWDAAEDAAAGVLSGQEIKVELELGPEELQPQDIAFSMTKNLSESCIVKQEPAAGAEAAADSPGWPRAGGPRGAGEHEEALITNAIKFENLSESCTVKQEPGPIAGTAAERPASLWAGGPRGASNHEEVLLTNATSEEAALPVADVYSCDSCGEQFNLRTSLILHNRVHSQDKPHSCDVCHKSFKHRTILTEHMRVHTGVKPFTCDTCQKSFTQRSHLTKHKLVHTGGKPHTCDVCQKYFKHRTNLAQHMLVHTGVKPFTCDICQKSFTQRSNLNKHKLVHSGGKPHTCDTCQKTFRNRSNLTQHMLVHTGVKPHTCNICRKSFTHRSHLKQHKVSHTGDTPHTCDICQKTFKLLSYLAKHKLVHTGDEPHACNMCHKKFKQMVNLKKHKRTHIGEVLSIDYN